MKNPMTMMKEKSTRERREVEEATEDSEEKREEVVNPRRQILEHIRMKDRKNGNLQQPEILIIFSTNSCTSGDIETITSI